MKRYDSYKDSGVEWLGEIPKEWNTSKMKFELTIFGRIGFRGYTTEDIVDEGEGVISLSPSNITDDFDLKLSNSTFISYEKYDQSPEIKVFENDIVLVKTSSIGKVTIIKGESLPKMTLNPQLIVLKKVKPNNRFLYYYLISSYFQYELQNEKSGGVMSTISQQKIKDFNLIIPPLSEQQQIVSFLDTKTSLIDSLIEKTQRKIELLKEKKTSLISEVVTKGLNPNVNMKDSGVEWIGDIPDNWNWKRMCYMFKPVSIKNTSGEINLSVYRDYGVIPTNSRDDNHNVISEDTSNYKLVNVGDFVMNKMKCWMGSLGLSDYRGIVSPSYTVMKSLTQSNRKYLHNLLRSQIYIPQYRKLSYGVRIGQWDMRFEDFRELPCLIPPLSEQRQIVEYLDEQTQKIDNTISIEEKRIELLKEYRQSLISEVVTGKRKVV
jgi:type I restriction enzyme, S subunit